MDIKKIYNELTSVDIDEQKQLWDERGKGYYGEFILFCDLYSQVPGVCKILMNLNVPTADGKTTEIDLLMIHETGIYVFEVKHYKGTIYGDDSGNVWTQYFRTTKNSTFKNPILQNDYHITAIKNLFPNIPVSSIIVFTNRDCNLKITNNNPNISVCELSNLSRTLNQKLSSNPVVYSIEEIDSIFIKLSKYSQMKEPVMIDGIEKSFMSWLEPSLLMLTTKNKELENEINTSHHQRKSFILFASITILIFLIFGSIALNSIKQNYNYKISNLEDNYNNKLSDLETNYNHELEKFKQNFLHIDEFDNEYIEMLNDFVDVTNISLVRATNNSIAFTARLSMNTDFYAISIQKNSKYIVMTKDDKVYEYDVFGKHLSYNAYYNTVGKGYRDYGDLAKAHFWGLSVSDVKYIKITNIKLFKLDSLKTIIKDDLDLELYKK